MQANENYSEENELERLFLNVSFTESQKNMYRRFSFIYESEQETPTCIEFLDVFDLNCENKESLIKSYKKIHKNSFNEASSDFLSHCEKTNKGVNLWFPYFGMIEFNI